MAGGTNLAKRYAKQVDERFYQDSQAALALNKDYEFTGVDTVNVYSIQNVPMKDYQRTGTSRYGTPDDLTRTIQTLKLTKDRAFTFIIDKGDKIQTEMVSDAGKALARQIREVWVPEYDTNVFAKLAAVATSRGNYSTEPITKTNAYESFLKGQEMLGNKNVPDKGRVAFCSYAFANMLMQDSAFMKYSDSSQEMTVRGVLGEVDGCKIVRVASGKLPAGCAFILAHPQAATAPKQLEDYRIHDNPPGISGWLCEGRVIYDVFVLNEKADGIYYHGSQAVLKVLTVQTAGTSAGKSSVMVIPGTLEKAGNRWYYDAAASYAELETANYGTAVTTSDWTELTVNGLEITPNSTDTVVRVIEVNAESKPIACGDALLNIG